MNRYEKEFWIFIFPCFLGLAIAAGMMFYALDRQIEFEAEYAKEMIDIYLIK